MDAKRWHRSNVKKLGFCSGLYGFSTGLEVHFDFIGLWRGCNRKAYWCRLVGPHHELRQKMEYCAYDIHCWNYEKWMLILKPPRAIVGHEETALVFQCLHKSQGWFEILGYSRWAEKSHNVLAKSLCIWTKPSKALVLLIIWCWNFKLGHIFKGSEVLSTLCEFSLDNVEGKEIPSEAMAS